MPPGGGLMRVESVEQSRNPLALIIESYARLMDTFRIGAEDADNDLPPDG